MMLIIAFILFTVSQFLTGRWIFRKLFGDVPKLFEWVGSFLLGVFVTIPITYLLSCVFSFTSEPQLWAMITYLGLGSWVLGRRLRFKVVNVKKLISKIKDLRSVNELLILLFCLVFSTWLMMKTFHGDGSGQLFVGSNNIFDFGLFVGLFRSIAWGENIPFGSPFFSGAPLFYHYFFQFWVSLWEYVGVPTVWAVNIPSILSFSSLLVVVYYLPQIVLKKNALVGWIAVALTITHSTMTFWRLIRGKGISLQFFTDIWILPTYPFAGPFDGSTISIFTTLNSYVNQRHLAFGIAVGLLIYIGIIRLLDQKKAPLMSYTGFGMLTGLLFLWNMAICVITGAVVVLLFTFHKHWKFLLGYIGGFLIGFSVLFLQYVPYSSQLQVALGQMKDGSFGSFFTVMPTWTIVQYLWENMTILPFLVLLGFFVIPGKHRKLMFPFLILFLASCFLAGVGKRGFDQKVYSFLIITLNCIAAVGISWFWTKRSLVSRMIAVILFFIVTVSGAIDLMAVKNEFAYPFVGKDTILVISWIRGSTPKNAVFVSYSDMIDPVVLSGRKNYFGFFGNIGWTDRSDDVKEMYAGNIDLARDLGISYILAPKWGKSDFPYIVDMMYFREHRLIVYEDERYIVYEVPHTK